MKIQNKLFLILFGFSFLLVTSLVLLMQWSLDKGMIEYVNSKEVAALQPLSVKLSQEYQKKNNWQTMIGEHQKFHRMIYAQLLDSEFSVETQHHPSERMGFRGENHRPKGRINSGPKDRLKDSPHNKGRPRPHGKGPPTTNDAHYALLDVNEKIIVGRNLKELEYSKTAIKVNDDIVGYFAVSKRNQLTKGYEVDFIEQQQSYLWAIALFAMCLVALITLPLAKHLVEPIKLITSGMHKLTQGEYQQKIELNRKDELGKLSRDYNELAFTLAENETARKRWLADISHELRTPVAILRGELEAMIDEVRPLTKGNVSSAHDEVKHLQRLIDDLNLLTSADVGAMNYRKQHENVAVLLEGEADKYRSYLADAGITLSISIVRSNIATPNVYLDKTRLYQLFENIINNSVKYSEATEFSISLLVETIDDKTITKLILEDNGVGVASEHLPHLFEHLYRVEDSRNRKTGGSGLGLSICRQIVIAHQGEISAEKSTLGGLAIIIQLPIT